MLNNDDSLQKEECKSDLYTSYGKDNSSDFILKSSSNVSKLINFFWFKYLNKYLSINFLFIFLLLFELFFFRLLEKKPLCSAEV